jgi:hypothetical protein
VTTLNIGDAGTITFKGKPKRIRVTGYWKFKRLSECEDALTRKLLAEIVEREIADGVRKREERIEPCLKEEAQLVGTNSSFFDVNDVELDSSAPPVNSARYEDEHRHKLEIMLEHGEFALYGRIKLPIEDYPRFFDSEGRLLPEFDA